MNEISMTAGRHAPASGVVYDDDRLAIWSGNVRWIRLSGEIDAGNSTAVARTLARVGAGGGLVIVDLGQLRFIDLSGLRVLGLLPGASIPYRLRPVNMPPFLSRLLAILAESH